MMQNSGLGNAVSPLSSLNWVFRIPVLLIVTLRGEPGLQDEPQHELMGQITGRILDELVPGWYDEAPVQRWVTRRQTMIMTGEQALTVDYRTEAWGRKPYNGATTYRPDFDNWLADKAVESGAELICSTTATGRRHGAPSATSARCRPSSRAWAA